MLTPVSAYRILSAHTYGQFVEALAGCDHLEMAKKRKNQAAVSLGRKGGLVSNPNKGFGSLSKKQRSAAAKKAALARWKKP